MGTSDCGREWSSSDRLLVVLWMSVFGFCVTPEFPCWGLGNHGVACHHCVCEAWTVSERCVTPRQGHGGTISSADSLAVLFLMPHPLASPGTVFCRGLAWFTEKKSSAGTLAFPFLPKRLFCRIKAAPWRCISRIYAPAESV